MSLALILNKTSGYVKEFKVRHDKSNKLMFKTICEKFKIICTKIENLKKY